MQVGTPSVELMQQTAIRISDVQELLLWVLADGLRTSWALVKVGSPPPSTTGARAALPCPACTHACMHAHQCDSTGEAWGWLVIISGDKGEWHSNRVGE